LVAVTCIYSSPAKLPLFYFNVQIETDSTKRRLAAAAKLRDALCDPANVKAEKVFIVMLPDVKAHVNHLTGEVTFRLSAVNVMKYPLTRPILVAFIKKFCLPAR
jgi:hypothetical protein